MEYDVHLFAVVRVKIVGVDARSEKAAAQKATRLADLHRTFACQRDGCTGVSATEYDDTITHYLVEPAGNSELDQPRAATCFEPFGKGKLTAVPFDRVSTHVAVVVDGGNVQSVMTNRPCQVVVLDHDHAQDPLYDVDGETEFHDSQVDPSLRCQQEFQEQYRKEMRP